MARTRWVRLTVSPLERFDSNLTNNQLELTLPFCSIASGYNFGELLTTTVRQGDTATIGIWQNNNGQALLKKLNGSSTATKLGNWLAITSRSCSARLLVVPTT